MKLYEVLVEQDGPNTNGSTPISQMRYYFGAGSVDEVWDHITWLRNDPDRTIVAITQVVEQFDVVPTKENHNEIL